MKSGGPLFTGLACVVRLEFLDLLCFGAIGENAFVLVLTHGLGGGGGSGDIMWSYRRLGGGNPFHSCFCGELSSMLKD